MKTSTIKSVKDVKEWSNDKGTTYYANVEMDNGDKLNVGLNKHAVVGMSFDYTITETDGQQEYAKAKAEWKTVRMPNSDKGTSNSTSDSILYQVCLKGVMEFYAETFDPAFQASQFDAEAINEIALEIAQKAKENISKL